MLAFRVLVVLRTYPLSSYVGIICISNSGEDSSEHVHFIFTQAASVLLGMYLLSTTVISDTVSLSDTVTYILIAIMVILLMSPLAIPLKMTLFPTKKLGPTPANSSDDLVGSTQTDPLLRPSSSATLLGSFYEIEDASDGETLLAVGEGAVKKRRRPRRGEDFKFREALIKADFWLLWFSYFLGVGSGVTVLNNLAQIGVAVGVDDTTMLLALFSFCNFAGRLGSGAVSEYYVMAFGNPIGAILFSAMLAGYVYDAEAAKQGRSTCVGADCFRLTFLVLAGVCGLGTILSIILTIRVRPVYQLLYAGGSFRLPQNSDH